MIRVVLIAVLILLVARAFWQLVDGIIEAAGGRPAPGKRSTPPSVRLARDPVCGTHVPINAAVSLTTKGQTQYFCSERCRDRFLKRT